VLADRHACAQIVVGVAACFGEQQLAQRGRIGVGIRSRDRSRELIERHEQVHRGRSCGGEPRVCSRERCAELGRRSWEASGRDREPERSDATDRRGTAHRELLDGQRDRLDVVEREPHLGAGEAALVEHAQRSRVVVQLERSHAFGDAHGTELYQVRRRAKK
jgi:hypothetical protein